ncbi:hypothetical protein D3C76_1457170 [compost metagenome]
MLAGQQVEAELALAQPVVQEGVDALLPVVAEQGVGLGDELAGGQEEVERGLGRFEQGDVQVDAEHGEGSALGIPQHRAHGADLLAVPVELLVGTDVPLAHLFAEHVFQGGVVAYAALGDVVGDVVDLLRAQVVQHHLGMGEKQRGDGVGDRPEVIQCRIG